LLAWKAHRGGHTPTHVRGVSLAATPTTSCASTTVEEHAGVAWQSHPLLLSAAHRGAVHTHTHAHGSGTCTTGGTLTRRLAYTRVAIAGTQMRAQVEYAPFQQVPKARQKKDPREGTYDQGACSPLPHACAARMRRTPQCTCTECVHAGGWPHAILQTQSIWLSSRSSPSRRRRCRVRRCSWSGARRRRRRRWVR
jgi:hypothetical protein